MKYIVVDEQDQKLLAAVALLLNKASFTLDSQEVVGAANIFTSLAKLSERIKAAEEFPQQRKE